MPDSCFVPMEGQPAGNVRRDGAYGESNWGSPAFRVFSGASRKPRMVIDYRRVNQVTVRATFAMPDSVSVKRASAGKRWYSTGDGVSGFNQIENSLFAQRVLAVVSLSGKHLPRSLGFRPTNGPEDFSRFGFRPFRRKLFRTWFLFIDHVLVATGVGSDVTDAIPEDQLSRALDALARGRKVRAESEETEG